MGLYDVPMLMSKWSYVLEVSDVDFIRPCGVLLPLGLVLW